MDGNALPVISSLIVSGDLSKNRHLYQQNCTIGRQTDLHLTSVRIAEKGLIMETRLVNVESNAIKRYGAFFSELLYMKKELSRRLDMVENGKDRLEELIQKTSSLFEDMLETVPENQKRNIRNTFMDYKVSLVPVLSQASTNVIMTKDNAKTIVDYAQEKCKSCVEDDVTCRTCGLYKALEGTVIPDMYETNLCPYSLAEWAD